MFRKVLVALDGSTRSERSAPWARKLAAGAETTLVKVIDLPDPLALHADIVSEMELDSTEYLKEVAARFSPPARTVTKRGPAAHAILEVAAESGSDLLVTTTHGGSTAVRRFVGGTAEKLIYGSEIPLLLIPSRKDTAPPEKLDSIAVPLDGSEVSEKILPLAVSVAKEHGTKIRLIHSPIDFDPSSLRGRAGIEKELQDRRTALEKRLEEHIRKMKGKSIDADLKIVPGPLPEVILESAAEAGADLIIMAGHGYGWVQRALLGSVASRLIQTSTVPVLVLKNEALRKLDA